jgi:cobalt-zinc-cadmium resistance protein CzcA
MPRTTSLEESARIAPRIRAVIARAPEVRGVMSQVGRPDDGTDVTSFFNLEFNVPLKPMEQWRERPRTLFGYPISFYWKGRDLLARTITREQIQDDMMESFKEDFPALNFNFSQLIRDNVEEALSGVKGANSVKLFGSDLAVLEDVGQKVANILRSVRGIENVGLFHIVGQPNLEIQIDREACARYGINVADVEAAVQVAIGGRAFSRMVEGEKLYAIVLRLPEGLRDDLNDISRISVDVPGS